MRKDAFSYCAPLAHGVQKVVSVDLI